MPQRVLHFKNGGNYFVEHKVEQCSAEKFRYWGQCPRGLEKVGKMMRQ